MSVLKPQQINNFLEVFQELCFDFEVEMLGILHSFAG